MEGNINGSSFFTLKDQLSNKSAVSFVYREETAGNVQLVATGLSLLCIERRLQVMFS